MPELRNFEGGATRDSDAGKLDFEGFLSPAVLWQFALYMDKHRALPDGSRRGSDNWQNGMPADVYMKSLLRHVFDLWLMHRGGTVVRPENGETATLDDTLGGILFNLQGYWLQTLRARETVAATLDDDDRAAIEWAPPSPEWEYQPDCDCDDCAAYLAHLAQWTP